MSKRFTPSGTPKFTNVSIVRMKKGGKRFEVVCNVDKISGYKDRTIKDPSLVLATETIFVNSSKGEVAKKTDLVKCFGTGDEQKIAKEILDFGTCQTSTKEVNEKLSALTKEVITFIADKCIDPISKRPYTPSMIENAMEKYRIFVDIKKAAKPQAIQIIQELKRSKFPIERVKIGVTIRVPVEKKQKILEYLKWQDLVENLEEPTIVDEDIIIKCLVSPGAYGPLSDAIKDRTNGIGHIYTMDMK